MRWLAWRPRAPVSASRGPRNSPTSAPAAAVEINRLSRDGATPLPPQLLPSQNRNFGEATLNLLSFEVDIWGRLRRATEAARANLLSAEENRKAVVTTLVSDVATAYLSLRELDYELEISKRTLETREAIARTHQIAAAAAVFRLCSIFGRPNNWWTLRRRPSRAFSSRSSRPRIRSGSCWEKILAMSYAGTVLTEQDLPPEVPAGLPSELLERRPDIRAAEAGSDRRQCADRRGEGGLFSPVEFERSARGTEHATVEPVQRTGQHLEPGAAGYAADLHGREAEIRRQTGARPSGKARWCNTKRRSRPRFPRYRTA